MQKQSIRNLSERLQPAPVRGGFRLDGYWVWCGSVVKGEDGRYHMFASRWPKWLPMHPGWLLQSEIVRASSDVPEGPYRFEEVVLPARSAEYWDGRSTHNPHITKYGDDYILYYMGSTHPLPEPTQEDHITLDDPRVIVARSNKRIGIAVSKSVFGPWERFDAPILQTRPGMFDSFLVSNPAPCVNEDGSVLLIYKSRRYVNNIHSDMMLGCARADHYLGPYEKLSNEPMFPPGVHLEDPFIWRTEAGYEMIAKDMEGNLCGEKHGGIHAVSANGLDWKLTPNQISYSRTIRWDSGETQTMGNLERPFLLFEDGRPICLFAAVADGAGGFRNASNTWNQAFPISRA